MTPFNPSRPVFEQDVLKLVQRIACLGALGAALLGCSSEDTGVRSAQQRLTEQQSRVLGFETPASDWSANNGSVISSSGDVTQGSQALSVNINGYTQLSSAQIAAPGNPLTQASLDIKLGQPVSWGEARLVVVIPSAGHYWRDIGGVSLSGRSAGTYHTLKFDIPSDVQNALSGSATDVSFRVIVNGPWGSQYLLDNLVVSDAGGDGTPSDPGSSGEVLSLSIPMGQRVEDVVISGTSKVTIDDRSTIGEVYKSTVVSSVGPSTSEYGAGVKVYGNVLSEGDVDFLRSQSHIFGSLTTEGVVVSQDNVAVDGGVFTGVPINNATTEWTVEWPEGAGVDISLPPDTPNVNIAPGHYGSIRVYSRSTITLRSGIYFVDSFFLEPQVTFNVDASNGPVQIYVKDTLLLRSGITTIGGEEGQVLFGYLGTQTALFEEALTAAVVAPNSTIELRRPASGNPHKGSFFGKEVHVFSDATVLHVPLDWVFVCERGDSDGDGIFDCFEDCTENAEKGARGDCGCEELDIDSDGDGVMDCLDGCPLDPRLTRRGTCGCSDSPAPEGTACADGLLCEESVCDGTGICGTVQDGAPEEDDCFARELDGRLYWICEGALSWQDAQERCADIEGRSLAQLDGERENRFVSGLLGGQSAWIGANDLGEEGSFYWTSTDEPEGRLFWQDGKRVDNLFDSWSDRAFESDSANDCVAMTGLSWSEAACSEAKAFVCESRSASGCGPMPPTTTCGQFHPGRDCTSGIPGGSSDECVDQEEGANLLEAMAQFQAEYDACFAGCAPGDTFASCVDSCTGALEVPEAGSTCSEAVDLLGNPIEDGHERACEMDHYDLNTECTTDADCTLPGYICVMYYEPDCQVCDQRDADDKCVRKCLGKTVCALPSGDCDGGEPALCREVEVCGEDDYDSTFSDPTVGDDADLTTEEYLPDDDFPPPPAERPDDEEFPEDPACPSPPCAKNDPNHPWCSVDVVNDGVEPGTDPPNEMGSRDIDKKKSGRSGDGDLVSFSFDPQTILEYSAEPQPFGALDFEVHAGASFLASTEFRMLGARAKLDLLDARVKLDAELCYVSTEDTRVEVMGHDFLPALIEVFNQQTGSNVERTDIVFRRPARVDGEISEQEQNCIDAFDAYTEAVDRAKKSLRDVQELIRQYEELIEHNLAVASDPALVQKRFESEFCESVAKNPPEFFPALDCSINPEPEVVINAFIDYYTTVATTHLDNALRDMTSKSFNASKNIELFDIRKDISENVVTANFAVGPIPCVLEIDVFMHYGLSGHMRYDFFPGNLIGMNDIARDLVWLHTQATPSAGAGISLFVGAGGGVPGFNASVGVYGEVNLADLELPMWAGAGIQAAAEPDPRGEDLDVIYPPGGPLQYSFNARYDVGAEARITNILAANLGVRLKIEFLFFSVKYKKALLTLDGFNAPPIPLIHGEGTSQSAEFAPKWAVVRMPFYLPEIPHLNPGGLPAEGDEVEEVSFTDELSAELFYDSQCTCSALTEDCFRNDDCCGNAEDGTGTNVCFLNMGLENEDGTFGRKVCSGCREVYTECNVPSDCCGGEEEMNCTAESYEVKVGEECPEPTDPDDFVLCFDIYETVYPTSPVCQPKPSSGGGGVAK